MIRTYSPQTPQSIRATAELLARSAAQLTALATAMETLDFAEIRATHGDQRKRCMECATKFVAALDAALLRAREERGDFGQVTPSNHKAKTA